MSGSDKPKIDNFAITNLAMSLVLPCFIEDGLTDKPYNSIASYPLVYLDLFLPISIKVHLSTGHKMIPIRLVMAMATFLKIDSMVVILDTEHFNDDQVVEALLLHSEATKGSIKLHFSDVKVVREICDFSENTVMLDYSLKDSLYNGPDYSKSCFMDHLFWVVEKTEVLPPNLRFDSNYYTVHDVNSGNVSIEEHYHIKGTRYSNMIGHWSEECGLRISEMSKWERRKDLSGVSLDIATNVQGGFVHRLDNGGYGGYLPEVIKTVQLDSNFSISWAVPKDKKYGVPIGNGSWNGIVGMVQRGEVDLSAATLAVTLERSHVITYSKTLMESHSTLIVAHPSLSKQSTIINMDAFLNVFTPKSWFCILIIYCLITFASFVIYTNIHVRDVGHDNNMINPGMKSLKFSYCTFLKLNLSERFTICSGKFMVIVSGLVSIVLMAYYEGTLTSFLTAKTTFRKLTSFRDTIEQGYSVILVDGTKHATEMENALPGTAKHEVYHKLIKNNPKAYYANTVDVIEAAVENPRFAIFGPALMYKSPKLYALKGLVEAEINYMALTFPKKSELVSFFDHYILKMRQGGVLQFLKDKWLDGRKPLNELSYDKVEEVTPIGFENTGFLITVLCCGIFIAPLALALEWLCKIKILSRCNNIQI